MIDETTADYRAAALAGMGTRQEGAANAGDAAGDKGGFRQALDEIREKGFRAYVGGLQAAKLEEMRKEILESMGISEDDLAAMSPQQRAAVDDMVEAKIRERLAGNTLAEKGTGPDKLSAGELADHLQTLPNGLGSAMLMLQALDQAPERGGETG